MLVDKPVSISKNRQPVMTMEKGVFIFTVGLLAFTRSVPATLETVWLKDVTTRFQTDKRTLGDLDLPNELTFNISRGSDNLTLNLKRNHYINPNADIYFVRKLKDGKSVLVKTRDLEKEDVAYYQDRENGAYITVRCFKNSNEQCERNINGHIRIGDRSYDLRPAETDVTSRNLLQDPGLLGKRYVLQDQTRMQRENSVESEDAAHVNEAHVNEKEVEQELKAVLRRFQGQQEQNQHNRRAADKSRQVKAVYYIKVALLIDLGLWNLYSSTVHTVTPGEPKSRQVKRKIRELFSHVMNGVNLLYKGIEDTSISINIILREFIFIKRLSDFEHIYSEVKIVNGKKLIAAANYMLDFENWDFVNVRPDLPPYDHAMLFTNYKLYKNSTDETDIGGIGLIGRVCDIGRRISIVESGDYIWMVQTAAHELGHNLGADHDGTGNATSCKADDFFIMTPKEIEVGPNRTYSRNSWRFSNCSVEAFKDVLKHKYCVAYKGNFFSDEDYYNYVKKQPGEVYSTNEQCRLIYGAGSVRCQTVTADLCHAMRCTDPNTGRCMTKYVRAARGTKCGTNMDQAAACLSQPCMKSEKAQDFHVG